MGTRKSAPVQETAIEISTRTTRSKRSQMQQKLPIEPSNTLSPKPDNTPPATSEIEPEKDNELSSTNKDTQLEGMLLLSQAVDSAFNTMNNNNSSSDNININNSSSDNINNTNTQETYESDDLLEMLFENYTPPTTNPPTPDLSLPGSTISSPLPDPSDQNEAEKDENETNGANQSKRKRKMGGLLKCACNHCKSAHVGCDSGRPCRVRFLIFYQ